MPQLGLFPLRLVAFPGERLPLHIFEPRYRELMAECLASGDEFGILLADDDGIRAVGTRAAIVEVLEQLPDGRLNILVEGRERFRLAELTEGRSFHTGVVEPFVDEDDPAAADVEADADAAAEALRLLQALAAAAGVDVELPRPDSPTLSFEVAARVELELEDEQELLEQRSERRRLARVTELLGEAVERTLFQREVHERAQTNGKLPHPPSHP